MAASFCYAYSIVTPEQFVHHHLIVLERCGFYEAKILESHGPRTTVAEPQPDDHFGHHTMKAMVPRPQIRIP
jgi:hypothetical protein